MIDLIYCRRSSWWKKGLSVVRKAVEHWPSTAMSIYYCKYILLRLTYHIRKMPANNNTVDDCAKSDYWLYEGLKIQLDLLNLLSCLRTTNHNWNEWINEKDILAILYSELGWANQKFHEAPGRVVHKRLTPKSDRATLLYAFARWLVSSKHGLA